MDERKKMSLPMKFVTGFAVGGLLGFGLCAGTLMRGVGGDNWWSSAATLGGFAFFLCAVGMVVS